MDKTLFNLLSNIFFSGKQPSFDSSLSQDRPANQNPSVFSYPPEAEFKVTSQQQPLPTQPNITALLSSLLGKNGNILSQILSKQGEKKEEESSSSAHDEILL